MRSRGYGHPEWGYLAPAPSFLRTVRTALLSTFIGGVAGAAVVFSLVQRPAADHETMVEPSVTAVPDATAHTAALPAAHAAVFELKPGEVSQVINDSGGHYIYKINSKDEVPLDKAESEIKSTLQNQRTRDMIEKVNGSYKVETNEKYFGPPAAAMPPPRMQNPRMAPPPAMQRQQQTPPPAQPQAQKPN